MKKPGHKAESNKEGRNSGNVFPGFLPSSLKNLHCRNNDSTNGRSPGTVTFGFGETLFTKRTA
jgi:hypothetical protein